MNVSGNTLMPREGAPVSNDYYRLINRAPGSTAAQNLRYRERIVGKPYVAPPRSNAAKAKPNNNGFITVTRTKRGRRSTRRSATRRANRRAASRRANRR